MHKRQLAVLFRIIQLFVREAIVSSFIKMSVIFNIPMVFFLALKLTINPKKKIGVQILCENEVVELVRNYCLKDNLFSRVQCEKDAIIY